MISNPRFIVGRKVESSCQQIIRALFIFLTPSQQSTVNSQQSTSSDGATGIDIILHNDATGLDIKTYANCRQSAE